MYVQGLGKYLQEGFVVPQIEKYILAGVSPNGDVIIRSGVLYSQRPGHVSKSIKKRPSVNSKDLTPIHMTPIHKV